MKQPQELQGAPAPPDFAGRSARIRGQILDALGHPGDLHKLQVRWLWDNCYRVNVFTGPDAVSARVVNSYFVVADDAGAIVRTSPRIVRQYPATVVG